MARDREEQSVLSGEAAESGERRCFLKRLEEGLRGLFAGFWPVGARRQLQEAKERIEEAEYRLERSVGTNIGLRRKIRELKERLAETAKAQADFQRRIQGLEGQLHQAVRLADDRGKNLKKMRAQRRAERGELPVQDRPERN